MRGRLPETQRSVLGILITVSVEFSQNARDFYKSAQDTVDVIANRDSGNGGDDVTT